MANEWRITKRKKTSGQSAYKRRRRTREKERAPYAVQTGGVGAAASKKIVWE